MHAGVQTFAQPYPNPYREVDNWAKLPNGRTMGAVGDVTVDPDGVHIWAIIRCDATARERFGNECLDSDLDPVLKFDQEGNVVQSFGGGRFMWMGIQSSKQGCPGGIAYEIILKSIFIKLTEFWNKIIPRISGGYKYRANLPILLWLNSP